MATICVPVITALCVVFALMAVFFIVFIAVVIMIKDKMCHSLEETERHQDDSVDTQPRDVDAAADVDGGVYVISDVSHGRQSDLLDTTQLQVKGQELVLEEETPGPSRDEANECTSHEPTSEGTQYDTLAQQRPDECNDYMSLHVMSAAHYPQVVVQLQ